ncbi:uncharacterized protein LOC126733601 isoform X2 [Anthonomus grandis grandis]|uniref:uncharacterized protein LOC126733601 isoform X2 n=1 Tax=Anthonomus grandis grandis TaxID=2921223 RepID=UPI0021666ED9|nr:uncharacterized protein LOC126733601 isoform X2 [Anthonomus grandis grandis]
MYFLVKNIQSCTRFRGPDKLKLYPNGILNVDYLWRNISYFIVHPEQIRQKLKERDAHMLCQFLDSEEYKNKVTKFLETQDKILSKDFTASSITGNHNSPSIKYQHVLSCAQPSHRKPKAAEDTDGAETQDDTHRKRIKVKRGTIVEQMLKKKGTTINDDNISIRSEKPKKVRQIRSTIMPIFLKRIREKRHDEEPYVYQQTEEPQQAEPIDFNNQTARRLKSAEEDALEPMYAKILHKSNLYRKSRSAERLASTQPNVLRELNGRYHVVKPRTSEGKSRIEFPSNTSRTQLKPKVSQSFMHSNTPSKVKTHYLDRMDSKLDQKISNNAVLGSRSRLDRSPYRLCKIATNPEEYNMKLGGTSSVMPMRMMASSTSKPSKPPVVKLLPKKNMNLKSFSDLLCVEPLKFSRSKTDKKRTKNNPSKIKIHDDGEVEIRVLKGGDGIKKKKIKAINVTKHDEKIQMLVDNMQQSRSLRSMRLDNTSYENECTMERMKKIKEELSKNKNMEVSSLFRKVKLGSSKNADTDIVESLTLSEGKPKPLSKLEKTILRGKRERDAKERLEEFAEPLVPKQSFTYKIVSRKKVQQEEKLREIFKMNLVLRGGTSKGSSKKAKEAHITAEKEDAISVDNLNKNRYINLDETKEVVSRNIPKTLHRPVPHFVEHASKPSRVHVNQFRGYHKI